MMYFYFYQRPFFHTSICTSAGVKNVPTSATSVLEIDRKPENITSPATAFTYLHKNISATLKDTKRIQQRYLHVATKMKHLLNPKRFTVNDNILFII